ncbi:hypothetical protein D9M72_487310 [compost metagenome]
MKPVEFLLRRICILACILNIESCFVNFSWLYQVGNDNTNGKRKSGDDLKIDQGFYSDTSHFFQISHPADAQDYRQENNWRYKNFDNADERIANNLHFYASVRSIVSNEHTNNNGDQYPKSKIGYDFKE